MPQKKCRYNNKHKFETEEDLLNHEKYCSDKSKRKDLKVCPYNPKHIVLTKQYEKHIKICKNRPKDVPKNEEKKVEENVFLKDKFYLLFPYKNIIKNIKNLICIYLFYIK